MEQSRHRPHVKICGLGDAAMIDVALEAGADEIGLVHFEKSPRHLAIDRMAVLRDHVGDRAGVTIVTVDAHDALIDEIARTVRPTAIQLHGGETPERVAAVRAATGLAAMKAISIASPADLDAIAAYRMVADRILLDARRPKGSDLPGGNGVSFDWSILSRLGPRPDIVLSGGLNAENVGAALRQVAPRGLDVSSGVETRPGVKDVLLIRRFFEALDTALARPIHERQAS